MKLIRLNTVTLLILILIIGSSCKKRAKGTMTVIKDCTGSYLRFNNKDYPICNEDKLDAFEDGATVKASFVKDDKCTSDRPHCATVHGFETESGTFRVTKIK